MSKMTVIDHSQIAKPVEIEVKQGAGWEYGVEIEVTRGRERARIVLDYYMGRLYVRQFGRDGYNEDAELGKLDIKFQ